MSIADARELRIDASDGALRLRRPGRPPEVLASAGDLTSAVWLDVWQTRRTLSLVNPPQWARRFGRFLTRRMLGGLAEYVDERHGGSVVISGRTGPVLSFYVDTFAPWGGDPSQKRHTSGAINLAQALGLTLEPADDTTLPPRRASRRSLVKPQPNAISTAIVAMAMLLLADVMAFLSMPFGETGAGLVLSAAALAAITPVLAMRVRYRRRFEHLVSTPPDPGERTIYRPPPEGIGRLTTHLQIGERDVVLVQDGGRERWLPGPTAAEGVTALALNDWQAIFLDDAGRPMLVLDSGDIAPDAESRDRLAHAVKTAGIEVTSQFLPGHVPIDLRYQIQEPAALFTERERGRIGLTLDAQVPLFAFIHLMGAVILAGSMEPWSIGILAPIGSLVCFVVHTWPGVRYRRWRSNVRKRATATPEQEAS